MTVFVLWCKSLMGGEGDMEEDGVPGAALAQ